MTKTETLKELLRAMELTTPKNIALRIAMTAVLDYSEAIKALPIVDAVEVVRCKDCIHYESDGGAMMICNITDMVGDDDDYCSYGVREEGE